jgi:predicted phage tail protein
MTTVLLYGHLRAKYGKYFKLAVNTPVEAVKLLSANFPDFKRELTKYTPGYHIFCGNRNISDKEINHPAGGKVIRFVPATEGSKKQGVLTTIVGIVLIVVGVYFEQPSLVGAGVSMAFGGVVQLLSRTPKKEDPNEVHKPSYSFDGPVNTTAQGHPVPVGYGQLIVGSAVLSGGIYVQQIGIGTGTATNPETNVVETGPVVRGNKFQT